MPRYILCVLLLAAGCRASTPRSSVRVVDFIKEFDRAEKRPAADYTLADRRLFETSHPSIVGPAPGRLVWTLRLPRRGVFHSTVALDADAPVRFRVGVSDDRIYEGLAELTLTAANRGWADLHADLTPYAGWKWSLFYRPDRIAWHIVLSADAVGGIPGRVVWGAPEITTDGDAAREYAARQRIHTD